MAQFLQLLRMELRTEWRSGYALSGIFLYVFSTVFLVYTASLEAQPKVWNTLFWIVILFASVNAVTKSFQRESGRRELYYYTLTGPIPLLLAKLTYNVLLLLVLGLLTYGSFVVFVGNPVGNQGQFLLALLLGSLGFGITFTFVSAIAGKAKNSATLTAILGFPLVVPILLELLKVSANALRLIQDTDLQTDILLLLGMDFLLLGLGLILFPFVWKD